MERVVVSTLFEQLLEDKLEALKKARVYAEARACVGSNVTPIEAGRTGNGTSTRASFPKEFGGPSGMWADFSGGQHRGLAAR